MWMKYSWYAILKYTLKIKNAKENILHAYDKKPKIPMKKNMQKKFNIKLKNKSWKIFKQEKVWKYLESHIIYLNSNIYLWI